MIMVHDSIARLIVSFNSLENTSDSLANAQQIKGDNESENRQLPKLYFKL